MKHSDLFMPHSTKTREEMLRFLGDAATANSEADLDPVLNLFNPVDDRKEMGEKFEETLGYNPITHYDFKDVVAAVDSVSIQVSDEGRMVIENQLDDIAKRAMAILEEGREAHIKAAVAKALSEFLGKVDADAAELFLFDGRPSVAKKAPKESRNDDPADDDYPELSDDDDDEKEDNSLLLDDGEFEDDDEEESFPELDEDEIPEFGDNDDD